MRKSYIIDLDFLSQNGLVYENMEPQIVNPMILRVQDNLLEPILCEAFYVQILDYADDREEGTPIPAEYTTLIEEYIQKYLMTETEKKLIIYNTNKITNKATGRNNDQYLKANDNEENKYLRRDIETDIVSYRNKLVRYLDANRETFTLYENCNCETKEGEKNTYSNTIDFL